MKIPDQCLKQSIAIIGRTGSGKTYTAKGLVERILADQARTCIIDPLGVWWGLRSSADGKQPAFPVVVFGGDHADVALTEGMGTALATTLADQNLPAIVDVSEFSAAGRTRFMSTFLEAIYVENRAPITFVVDEADMFAPQRPGRDQLTMLGRMEQICRRGRVRGFRPWLITQRPASLHKSVLSQANTLIAMQLTAPQDRDALGDWIEGQADRAEGKKVLAELPKLSRGEGFLWAPHEGILQRVKFPAISTYDSSRTPEEGEQLPQVKLAKVDLSAIGKALQEAEEKDEADDVDALRSRIAELEEQVGEGAVGLMDPNPEELAAARAEGFAAGAAAMGQQLERVGTLAAGIVEAVQGAQADLQRLPAAVPSTGPAPSPVYAKRSTPVAQPKPAGRSAAGDGGARRRIAIALAQNPEGLAGRKLAILADVKRGGSTWRGALAAMRKDAHVDDNGEQFELTTAGKAWLGKYEPLPTGTALRDHWRAKMGAATRLAVFDTILDAYPKAIAPAVVAQRAGVELGGSTWRGHMAFLRGLELVVGRDELRASPDLF